MRPQIAGLQAASAQGATISATSAAMGARAAGARSLKACIVVREKGSGGRVQLADQACALPRLLVQVMAVIAIQKDCCRLWRTSAAISDQPVCSGWV